ncbi:MAG: hypothetical protein L6M37_07015 [Candidatus Methylarchaceae archaeon HK02M1]|nr:hypothetical protein [Candidatus Methylarchaceae archaeon HK02M1]
MEMRRRRFKDKDFIKTHEDLFFCVVGYTHPDDRVLSYIRYMPSPSGKWGKISAKYSRTMPSYTVPYLLKNIEMLKKEFPDYVFYSNIFNTEMSAVSHKNINEHYRPEQRLENMLKLEEPDLLQKKAIKLATLISDKSGTLISYIGVTGSILIDIHRPEFSDIDLTVYGRENSLKIKEAILSLYEEERSGISKLRGDSLNRWCKEKAKDYPLTFDEARKIYDKKWNYGLFEGTNFSVHPVKLDSEISERYGDKIFTSMGMIKIKARVSDISDSMFLPHTYSLQKVVVEEGNRLQDIREVTTYEGFYGGTFETEDEITVRGKLEKVVDKKTEEDYYRVLVGSLEGRGREYIKPINLLKMIN